MISYIYKKLRYFACTYIFSSPRCKFSDFLFYTREMLCLCNFHTYIIHVAVCVFTNNYYFYFCMTDVLLMVDMQLVS